MLLVGAGGVAVVVVAVVGAGSLVASGQPGWNILGWLVFYSPIIGAALGTEVGGGHRDRRVRSTIWQEQGDGQSREGAGERGLSAVERDERQIMCRARQGDEQVVDAAAEVQAPSVAEHVLVRVGRGDGDPVG